MNAARVRNMTLSALFAALTCVATMVVHVEMPATNGYLNAGDAFVLLGAWTLGPVWGAFAGGAGSALADLLQGYPHYLPGTFVIKGAMAALAALVCRRLGKKHPRLGALAGGVAAELWMVLGYYLYARLLLGKGAAAAAGIPGNALQGALGLALAMALAAALRGKNFWNQVNTNG